MIVDSLMPIHTAVIESVIGHDHILFLDNPGIHPAITIREPLDLVNNIVEFVWRIGQRECEYAIPSGPCVIAQIDSSCQLDQNNYQQENPRRISALMVCTLRGSTCYIQYLIPYITMTLDLDEPAGIQYEFRIPEPPHHHGCYHWSGNTSHQTNHNMNDTVRDPNSQQHDSNWCGE